MNTIHAVFSRMRLLPGYAIVLLVLTSGCAIDRSITVGTDRSEGPVRVIDGDVEVLAGARAESVWVIDGRVLIHENATVDGRVHVTDGELIVRPGGRIGEGAVVQHARVDLQGARLDGGVELFCAGGVIEGSAISGTLRVRDRSMWHVGCDAPERLFIGPGSSVERLVVETHQVEVDVSPDASVGEAVGMARSD